MLIVISPAKTLDYENRVRTRKFSQPEFLPESSKLISQLKKFDPEQLSELMNISSQLGQLNFDRYASWSTPFDKKNARQSLFAFKGDVYLGLKADEFSPADISFAQEHLRILSGLYGVLKPLDLMQPYRLEMGTKLENPKGKDLYDFWGSKITQHLNQSFADRRSKLLVNLASKEYFSAVRVNELNAEVVSPVFKDYSNGKYKILSFFAKKARGTMAAWLIKNRVTTKKKLIEFDEDGYRYSEQDSRPDSPVFLRRSSDRV